MTLENRRSSTHMKFPTCPNFSSTPAKTQAYEFAWTRHCPLQLFSTNSLIDIGHFIIKRFMKHGTCPYYSGNKLSNNTLNTYLPSRFHRANTQHHLKATYITVNVFIPTRNYTNIISIKYRTYLQTAKPPPPSPLEPSWYGNGHPTRRK